MMIIWKDINNFFYNKEDLPSLFFLHLEDFLTDLDLMDVFQIILANVKVIPIPCE